MAKYKLNYTGDSVEALLNKIDTMPNDIESLILASNKFYAPSVSYSDEKSAYVLTLPYKMASLEAGQLVRVQGVNYNGATELRKPYIDILENGDAILIDGSILNGKYYDMVYDGKVFIPLATAIGLNGTPYVFTESGTYTIDQSLSYNVTVVGGGGGGAGSSAYMVSGGVANGGGGGITTGQWAATSSSIAVTIGKAGESKGYRDSDGGGTSGGYSSACGFTAQGGTGGYSYLGGNATHGTTGANGNLDGYYHNGVYYGKAGIGSGKQPTSGIVILVPIL